MWEQGDAYERYVGRWSSEVAVQFLAWLGVPTGKRWVDVGCGTGALSAAILERCAPASVIGVEPSAGFLKTAAERLGDRAVLFRAPAEELPLADGSADVVVSGLVLNFLSDLAGALREQQRVAPGGVVGAYVWDYSGRMDFMRLFWDAARELDPRAPDEGAVFALCHPEALSAAFADFRDVEVRAIDVPTDFADFEELWQPFTGGQGAAPAYLASLPGDRQDALKERMRGKMPGTDIRLTARAWAVKGVARG